MNKQITKLKMLPYSKTTVFYTPIEEEDEVIVRTGTIADGSCFVHAILNACSKEYVAMDKADRTKFVKGIRASLAGKTDMEEWEKIGVGLVAKIGFQENMNNIWSGLYAYLEKDVKSKNHSVRNVIKQLIESNKELNLYKIVADLLPLKVVSKDIIPSVYNNSEDASIDEHVKEINNKIISYTKKIPELSEIPKNKLEHIVKAVEKLSTTISHEAKHSAYKKYIHGLKKVSEEVDQQTIELYSEHFNCDIYFIDGRTRMPYQNASTKLNLKKRKSIIIMWVGGVHYEIVGRLLPGNKIQREFVHEDPTIQKLYTFLCYPNKISEKYPNLIPYLPKEYKPVNDTFAELKSRLEMSDEDTGDADDYYRASPDKRFYNSSDSDSDSE